MLATLSSVRAVLVPVPMSWLAVITSAVPSPFNLIPGIGRRVAATSPVMGGEADAHGLLDDMEVVFWEVEFLATCSRTSNTDSVESHRLRRFPSQVAMQHLRAAAHPRLVPAAVLMLRVQPLKTWAGCQGGASVGSHVERCRPGLIDLRWARQELVSAQRPVSAASLHPIQPLWASHCSVDRRAGRPRSLA